MRAVDGLSFLSDSARAELEALVVELVAVEVSRRIGLRAPAPSPFLSIPEAADYLRCGRQRIYDLLSAQRLTRFKDGRRVLVSRDELSMHLNGERRSPIAHELPPLTHDRFITGLVG